MNDQIEEFDEDDDLNREAIAEDLAEMGFKNAEAMAALTMICQRLIATEEVEDDEDLIEGERTRLGGVPDVDPSFEWPVHEGRPLAFLGQMDFVHEDFLLLFFYDSEKQPWGDQPSDRGSWKVIQSDRGRLRTAAVPKGVAMTRQRDCTMVESIMLPDSSSDYMEIEELEIPKGDVDLLQTMEESVKIACHHFGGYPSLLQGDMEAAVHLVSHGISLDDVDPEAPEIQALLENDDDWTLLCQFDSDADLGWQWADNGRLFFWIPIDDLLEMNYDNVWVVLQSS